MKKLAVLSSLALGLTLAAVAGAQSDQAHTAGDTILERARKLVSTGHEADGRKLVDSVLTASTPQDAIYGEALYTRAAMAPNAAEAERDYRRLLIETPLAPRAEDAILQLANLLQARGDRRGASDLLQRFMLTYANSPARPRASVSLVRLLFEQGTHQEARACEALRQAREAVPRENFELRNQLDFYSPRCAMYADAAAPAAPSAAPTTTRAPAPTSRPISPPVAAQPSAPSVTQSGRSSYYSVQIAAYNTEDAAQKVVELLVDRGLEARVDGTTRPFRVRIGRYTTRAEAVKAQQALKARGHSGFVAVVTP